MAQAMTCDICQQFEAVVMITQIGSGDIQATCPNCTVTLCETFAQLLREQTGQPSALFEELAKMEPAAIADLVHDLAPSVNITVTAPEAQAPAAKPSKAASAVKQADGGTMGDGETSAAEPTQKEPVNG